MSTAWVVSWAELTRTLRDPHVIAYLLAPIAVYPMMFWAAFQFNAYEQARIDRQLVRVEVVGPAVLVDAFSRPPFEIVSRTGDTALSDDVDVRVTGRTEGLAMEVELAYASTRPRSRRAHERALAVVESLRRRRVSSMLEVPVEELPSVRVVANAVDGVQTFGRRLVAVLVGYVGTFAMLLSAVYPAIDLVVAERQRHTLETLLLAPVPRWAPFVGKVVACTVLVVLAAVGNMTSLWMTLAYLQVTFELDAALALGGPLSLGQAMMAAPALIATAVLVASVNIAVVLVARTFKEGEMMGTSILMLGILPGFAVVLSVVAGQTAGLELLPFGNLVLVMQRAFVGELDLYGAVIPVLVNGSLAVLAFGVAAWLVAREDFLIGGRLPGWLRWLHRSEPS
ncbi:MAG: hypothetical protein KTR31_00365 [Myxococcales bacterium]|nr:hypothetical protein [Myxococcales bacterium]